MKEKRDRKPKKRREYLKQAALSIDFVFFCESIN